MPKRVYNKKCPYSPDCFLCPMTDCKAAIDKAAQLNLVPPYDTSCNKGVSNGRKPKKKQTTGV